MTREQCRILAAALVRDMRDAGLTHLATLAIELADADLYLCRDLADAIASALYAARDREAVILPGADA